MRLLKRIALVLAGLVVTFLVVGLLLPSAWRAERSIVVDAGAEHVLPLIDSPKRWMEWAPWTPERYPDMVVEHTGAKRGAGAAWSWRGESSGNGSMAITRSELSYGVDYDLTFEGYEPSQGSLRFEPAEGGTRVTWAMWGDMGMNPIGRYFGLMMDSMMEPDFEAGLAKLKARAEEAKAVAEKEAAAAAAAAAEAKAKAEAEAAAAEDAALAEE